MSKTEDNFNYKDLDKIFHSRIRLAAVAALASCDTADFNFLKVQTKATDGNLSIHLKKLEDAEIISVSKTFVSKKPKTFYKLTPNGRKQFSNYIVVLNKFITSGGDYD